MRKIRELLRLYFGEGLSVRLVGPAIGVPYTTVADHLGRARAAGLGAAAGRDGRRRAGGPAVRAGAVRGRGAAAAGLRRDSDRAAAQGRDVAAVVDRVQGARARRDPV